MSENNNSYIVCKKKRNQPRVDVRICEKCSRKEDCEEYQEYLDRKNEENA